MKKIHQGFVFSAIALALLGGCQSTQTTHQTDQLIVSPSDQRAYDTVVLENGIEVILVSDPSAEKSAASLSVGVGLLHDPKEHQGMAHYLEHMLFLGTKRFPDSNEYSEFMTQNGGMHNAYTWLDITNYMFKVNPDAYDEALDRFSDFFKNPLLTPEYTDKERNAVNAEWSMRREMDFFTTYKLERSMMGDHPANRFLIGNLETLKDTPNSKLHTATVNFFNQYYSANLMKLAMVSNRPLSEMRMMAKKHFSTIQNKNIEKPTVTAKLNFDEVGQKQISYHPHKDEKRLRLSFVIENNQAQFKSKPNHFLSYLIGSEMPGTPAAVLREKGWINNLVASTSPEAYGNYGTFDIDIALTDKGMKKRDEISGMIFNYLDLIRAKGIDEKYFKEIQVSLQNKFRFLEKQDEFSYVSQLSGAMQDYPINHAIDAGFRYDHFDAKAVQKVLDQLTPEHLRLWHISKEEETDQSMHFYDGQYQVRDMDKAMIEKWQNQAAKYVLKLPNVNRLLPENFDLKTTKMAAQSKPMKQYDKDGIQIWQQPSQLFPNQPKGKTWIYLNTALGANDAKKSVMLQLWQDLYDKQQAALIMEAGIAGMNMSLSSGNGLFLSLSGFTDTQSLLLSEALKALKPSLSPEAFKQAVDTYVRSIKSSEVGFPVQQLGPTMRKVMSRSAWRNTTLINVAENLQQHELSAFMEQLLQENTIRVMMFGNYDQSDVTRVAKQIQSAFPHRKNTAYTKTQYLKPQKGDRFVFQKELPVADLGMLDLYISSEPGMKQRAISNVLSRHLRLKAFDTLRTEEQLGYSVGAFATKMKDHAALGLFIQTPVKAPKDMLARFDQFKREYAQMLDKLTVAEFEKIKASTLVALREKPKNLSEEAGELYSDWIQEKWTFDTLEQMINETEKVTLQDIRTFYHQMMLNPETPRLNLQLKGQKFKDAPFAEIDGQQVIEDLALFHQKMKLQ